MHKALHPRDNIDRLYVLRKEERKGLASMEDSVDTSIQQLEDYIQKRGRRLITTTRNNTNDMRTSRTTVTRKKVGRKTTLWTFETTNKRHLTRENVDVAKKRKP